jgi:hypothetical protein
MTNAYQKNSGNKELRKPLNQEAETPKEEAIIKAVPKAYRKEEGALDPSLFIIISGGEVRERDYFSLFKNKTYSFPRIVVEFIAKDSDGTGGLDVDKLVEVALLTKAKKEESKSDDILDSINIVTDVDHFYSRIVANIPVCIDNNIEIVISNPCFEIWLYYSYYSNTPDFIVPEAELKISSQFKTYLGDKHKGGVDPRKAPFEIARAINNSADNFSSDENGVPELFSTQMHLLALKLYELTKEDIEREIETIEQKRKMYLRNK